MSRSVRRRHSCPVCGTSQHVRTNGTIGAHTSNTDWRACGGVGRVVMPALDGSPVADPVTPVPTPALTVGTRVQLNLPSREDGRRLPYSYPAIVGPMWRWGEEHATGTILDIRETDGGTRYKVAFAGEEESGDCYSYHADWLMPVATAPRPFQAGDRVLVRKPEDTNQYPLWVSDMDPLDGTIQTLQLLRETSFEAGKVWELDGVGAEWGGNFCVNTDWITHADPAPAEAPPAVEDPAEKVKHELVAAARQKADEMGLCGDFDRVINALGLQSYGLPEKEEVTVTLRFRAPVGARAEITNLRSTRTRISRINERIQYNPDWETVDIRVS